jgi:hypothetical protein
MGVWSVCSGNTGALAPVNAQDDTDGTKGNSSCGGRHTSRYKFLVPGAWVI